MVLARPLQHRSKHVPHQKWPCPCPPVRMSLAVYHRLYLLPPCRPLLARLATSPRLTLPSFPAFSLQPFLSSLSFAVLAEKRLHKGYGTNMHLRKFRPRDRIFLFTQNRAVLRPWFFLTQPIKSLVCSVDFAVIIS